ncbi:class I SAM-dependent methyltransferase [Ornithinicoccus halotolerans]|uniref:class I SAM-dependent methyltransferase n=1 Tax=Ornithinicoccus halotolerans TaxID=1748220 RepID=UPI001E3629BE|nr:class I SAM-dependent methyltransferase [Ornithinicoccus halotolerans]
MADLPEPLPSPNIWQHPDVYELENQGVDPDGAIWSAMRAVADWRGRHVLDVGCGSGYHLPLLAEQAGRVTGVEPHPPLAERARARVAALPHVQVLAGTAQRLPLPDRSVEVVHARWAYFFGPGCEPGLAELDRVVGPGGTAFVIDNDATRSTFAGWFRRAWPDYDPVAVERFWRRQGWEVTRVDMRWQFATREELAAVVRIEFPPAVAEQVLAEHEGTGVDYAVNLWHRRY